MQNEQENVEMGVCSITKAMAMCSGYLMDNKNLFLRFIKKSDLTTVCIEISCFPEETKIDEESKKWRRVYE